MKYTLGILSLLFMGSMLYSCSCSNEKQGEMIVEYEDEDSGLDEFEAFSLKPFGIDALIYLPGVAANIGAAVDPQVSHELDGYEWEIQVGNNFSMEVEDWGDTDAFDEELKQLQAQNVYDVEILNKEANFVYYKATLKVRGNSEDEKVGVDHVQYHVVAQHNIEGINYLFKTSAEGAKKPITDYMAKSVKSVKSLSLQDDEV